MSRGLRPPWPCRIGVPDSMSIWISYIYSACPDKPGNPVIFAPLSPTCTRCVNDIFCVYFLSLSTLLFVLLLRAHYARAVARSSSGLEGVSAGTTRARPQDTASPVRMWWPRRSYEFVEFRMQHLRSFIRHETSTNYIHSDNHSKSTYAKFRDPDTNPPKLWFWHEADDRHFLSCSRASRNSGKSGISRKPGACQKKRGLLERTRAGKIVSSEETQQCVWSPSP